MASSYLEIDRCNLIPLSLTSLCACQHRPSSKTLVFSRPYSKFKLKLAFHGSRGFVKAREVQIRRFCIATDGQILEPVSGSESNSLEDEESKEEASNSHSSEKIDGLVVEKKSQGSQLKKRVVFGLAIGVGVGGVVLAGGWIFTLALTAAVFAGAREYFELVRSRGIASGMTPPPRYVSRACSVICALMPMLTLYFGHIDVSVTSAAFVLAMALLLQRGNPRFSQLSSAMFGLFYCGYLPCFWVKLRCGLAAPALNTKIGAAWPILLGGRTQWTVGLVATLISISSIIAADTYAYLGGKFLIVLLMRILESFELNYYHIQYVISLQ
ncbi:Phosphatidate cytidylyltransferase 5 protein [Thalictrum thalictroides]|uniref:phosphatidate cytidylyltransferase n=1 Tax=Thalictrum thalictroides TaxID=46969 RepID=A0A7J6V436_THATH|nr:Phosphatidate cytidylyltransferase 5 protein [Thalictrum thalictroides]